MRRGPDAEYLTVRGIIDLGQGLHRTDLCDTRSISPDGISKRESERSVAGRTPSPVLIDGDSGERLEERSTTSLGGEGISCGLVAPRLL